MRPPRRSQGAERSTKNHPAASGDSEQRTNIRVVIRIRPENSRERDAQNARTVVRPLDEQVLVFDPQEEGSPSYFRGRRVRQRNVMRRKNRDKQFAFDHIFAEGASQEYVYEHTTKSVVDSVLSGYNCSVFAYGATGAGKTFTMLGGPNQPGIMFLTVMELYQKISSEKSEKLCDVAVSYLEIYNEAVKDLLVPSGHLAIREDPQRGVVVSGLSLHKPKNAKELFSMLEYGNTNRTQHPTDANAQSSRSHAVFQVFVRQRDRTANISTNVRVAKMSLIDLAGSERATVTTNRGARFREGANINRSLLALGNCINALADSKNRGKHVPYRNSKLTRLLKDSLGGNCKTVMIAAVSPSSLSYEDTFSTLRYADRAKEIKSNLQKNVVSLDLHITKYTQIIQELRTEVSELKDKLQMQTTCAMATVGPQATVPDNERTLSLQVEVHRVFQQRASIRKELLELESFDRDLTAKVMRKTLLVERNRVLHGKSTLGDKTISKLDRVIAAATVRRERVRNRKVGVEQRMKENQDGLDRLSSEMRSSCSDDGTMPQVLKDTLHMRHLEIEVKDGRRQAKHLRKFARNQESHIKASEKLMLNLITAFRSQYYLIKGSGFLTPDLIEQFECIQKQVEGEREVMWADQSLNEGSSEEAEVGDFNRLLNLPVLSCVQITPKAPPYECLPIRRISYAGVCQTMVGITPTANGRALRMPECDGQNIGQAQRIATPSTNGHQQPQRIITPQRAMRSPSGSAQRIPSSFTDDGRHPQRVPTPQKSRSPFTSAESLATVSSRSLPPPTEVEQSCSPVTHPVSEDSTFSRVGDVSITSPDVVKENSSDNVQIDGIAPLPITPKTSESPTSQVPIEQSETETNSSGVSISEPAPVRLTVGGNTVVKIPASNSNRPIHSLDGVARTISFDEEGKTNSQSTTSPLTGGKMTYAQVASSPVVQPTRLPFGEISVNSPRIGSAPSPAQKPTGFNESFTICKDVLQENFRKDTQWKGIHRRETFTGIPSLHHQRSKSHGQLTGSTGQSVNRTLHTDTLKKFGLPSMADTATGGVSRPIPAYMSMTKAAANKRRANADSQRSYSQSSKENHHPNNRGRPDVSSGPLQPSNRTGLSRAFSVGNLHQTTRNVSRSTHRNQSSWNL
ncbi:kinesin-like protein KIF18B isoform X2 [Strongylocentrotus purpuratus]|uniref:Kinesin motor domain-containing protein n=1 Tax=Strongylocentrotus purpuratus TaxID=7668 RepID=A0A7M7T0M3_STRPU|nr:kinesin-like protein KIF18B isoform X2 [Strongylocentrotus purpuratus]